MLCRDEISWPLQKQHDTFFFSGFLTYASKAKRTIMPQTTSLENAKGEIATLTHTQICFTNIRFVLFHFSPSSLTKQNTKKKSFNLLTPAQSQEQ
jgi:hypothetical protein